MILLGLLEFLCLVGIPVTLIGFIVQLARKKPSKKAWGLTLAGFFAVLAICIAITPIPDSNDKEVESKQEVSENQTPVQSEAPSSVPVKDEISADVSTSGPIESPKQEMTETEKFANENDISVNLAESLESVLVGMKLTDKSKAGVFHYDLSDIYDWKQIEDWAQGERYSAYMDMEHIWYIYVRDNTVVGVRDGHGNIFYEE